MSPSAAAAARATVAPPPPPKATLGSDEPAVFVDPTMISVARWGCSRRMRVVATILEPTVVRKILEHLGVRVSPLPRAPPRDPDAYAEQADFDFEAA